MKKQVLQTAVMMGCFLLVATFLHAAPPGGGGGADAGAPIDGGISLLVAAGASYGVKKLYNKKKAKEA